MRVENNGSDDAVHEFDTAPGRLIVPEIAVRNGPISAVAASPDGSRLLVANHGRHSVSILDTRACRVAGTVANIDEPYALAMGRADARRAYVSTVSPAYDSIAAIDVPTNTVVASYPVALSVTDMVVSPDGRYVYASRHGDGGVDVAVLDTATERVRVIAVATTPRTTAQCVRISPDGARLYVGTNGPAGGRVVVVGTQAPAEEARAVIDAVETGLPIRDVGLSPDGAHAYVASCAADAGAVIDVIDTRTHQVTDTHKIGGVGGILTGLTLSRDGERGYLVSDESVTVLCTSTQDVVGSIAVAGQPSCVAEGPDALLYIADYSGAVTVAPVAPFVTPGVENAA